MQLHEPSGLWFPDNEPRPQKMYDGLRKYINDADFMLSLLPPKSRKRTCVQAGGHIGMWPLKLAPYFAKVLTFEPDPLAYDALVRNTEKEPKIVCVNGAIGEHYGVQKFSYYSGRTAVGTMSEVKEEGDLSIDTLVYPLDDSHEDVAAIVLDIEGYEPWALRGARETIQRCRPLILCEMLRKSEAEIREVLASMNYLPVGNGFNSKCRDQLFAYEGTP